jgi:hypothetical protein
MKHTPLAQFEASWHGEPAAPFMLPLPPFALLLGAFVPRQKPATQKPAHVPPHALGSDCRQKPAKHTPAHGPQSAIAFGWPPVPARIAASFAAALAPAPAFAPSLTARLASRSLPASSW